MQIIEKGDSCLLFLWLVARMGIVVVAEPRTPVYGVFAVAGGEVGQAPACSFDRTFFMTHT